MDLPPAEPSPGDDPVLSQVAIVLVNAWHRAEDGGSFLRVLASLPRARLPGWAQKEVGKLEVAYPPGPPSLRDVDACVTAMRIWVAECRRRVELEGLRLELAKDCVEALRVLSHG